MASTNDPFQFQEFEESNLLAAASESTTISIEDDIMNPKFPSGFAPSGDEDPTAEDDKAELLSGERKSIPFWTFQYYQQFFNVDTHHVTERIVGSVLPWPGKNFIHVYLRRNPDLYGPFWICTTLVFAMAISGNISTFLVNLGKPNYKYTPEFGKVTIAATAIFSYAWLVPLAVWGFLLWRTNKIMNLVSYSFMEIVCVYGYSLSVYIPAVVLWIFPYEWLRWLSIGVALCLSGSVLIITFWPAVRDDKPRVIAAVMSAIVVLNVLLAVGCKAYFFSKAEPVPTPANLSTTAVVLPHTT